MKIEMKKALGRVIKKHRERLALTQEQLAELSGVNLGTLNRGETGRGIGSENLRALGVFFEVDAGELMKEAEKVAALPPEIRVGLKRVNRGADLVKASGRRRWRSWVPVFRLYRAAVGMPPPITDGMRRASGQGRLFPP